MPIAGSKQRRRVASANLALGTAVAFVVAAALLSFAPDRGGATDGWRLRGALDAGRPLPAPIKPV